MDLWLESVTAGFITEFPIDTAKSYTVAEQNFLRGTGGRYIMSLYTSIKILVIEA